jgi:hypothetical protein
MVDLFQFNYTTGFVLETVVNDFFANKLKYIFTDDPMQDKTITIHER